MEPVFESQQLESPRNSDRCLRIILVISAIVLIIYGIVFINQAFLLNGNLAPHNDPTESERETIQKASIQSKSLRTTSLTLAASQPSLESVIQEIQTRLSNVEKSVHDSHERQMDIQAHVTMEKIRDFINTNFYTLEDGSSFLKLIEFKPRSSLTHQQCASETLEGLKSFYRRWTGKEAAEVFDGAAEKCALCFDARNVSLLFRVEKKVDLSILKLVTPKVK